MIVAEIRKATRVKGTGSNKKYEYKTHSGVVVMMTKAQKRYADLKLSKPDETLVAIAREAYPNQKPDTLRQQAQANEKNKDITIYTEEQSNKAVLTIAELMEDKKPDVRHRAAVDVLDRTYGKATTRTEVQNLNLNINVEADMALSKDFTAFLKQKTVQSTSKAENA